MRFNVYELNGKNRSLVEKNVSFGRLKERCITLFKMYREDAKSEGDTKSVKGWTNAIVSVRSMTLSNDLSKLQSIYYQNGESFVKVK